MQISDVLASSLVSATEEVFATMLALPLTAQPHDSGPSEVPANVVATVAFAGHRKGLVVIYSSLHAAQVITGAMLGLDPDQVRAEVPDAMGEIANMVAGTFRNRLTTFEPPSDISVPTVTMGNDFCTLYSSAVHRRRCPFLMHGEPLTVELILTGPASAVAAA